MSLRAGLAALVTIVLAFVHQAAPAADGEVVVLMTFGRGERLAEQFGHSALWIRSRRHRVNAVFNLAALVDQPGKLALAQDPRDGYRALATRASFDLAFHFAAGRRVRIQALNLPVEAFDALLPALEEAAAEDAPAFRYDYFAHNCTTRLRDLLDAALGGALRDQSRGEPGDMSFREQVLRSVAPRWQPALDLALGPAADRVPDGWDELFLPEVLADALGTIELDDEPLVLADRLLDEGDDGAPQRRWDGHRWPSYAAGTIAAAVIALATRRAGRSRWRQAIGIAPALVWLLASGAFGALLTYHAIILHIPQSAANASLLLFPPSNLLLALLLLVARWIPAGKLRRLTVLLTVLLAISTLAVAVGAMIFMRGANVPFAASVALAPALATALTTAAWRQWAQDPRPPGP